MKTMLKRFLPLILFLLTSLTASASVCIDGIYYNFNNSNKTASVTHREYTGDVIIPATVIYNEERYSVTSIGGSAFYGCSSLTSVTIPNSVTSIGSYAFYGCLSLGEVTLGINTTTIGGSAFSGCSSLKEIEIPSKVTKIDNFAFQGCSSLKSVVIADRIDSEQTPLSLGSNGNYSFFSDCPLEEVYIGRPIKYSTSSSNGYSPFYRNSSLKRVSITDTETEIYDNEFYGCTSLKEVTIGDGVTSIGKWAFSGCFNLESFWFGSSIESIGEEAFSDCTALTTLISEAAVPPVCGYQALQDISKWDCTLYVPEASIASYQTADQWKDFFFLEANGIENVRTTYKASQPTLIYTLDGRALNCKDAKKGKIYIYKSGDNIVKRRF